MKYEDVHPTFRNLLGIHEAFRKPGFPSENIFILYETTHFAVMLKSRGKEFTVLAGNLPEGMDPASFQTAWTHIAESANNGTISEEDFQRMFEESPPNKDRFGFIMGLTEKKIHVPSKWLN
jgi:hypothetical protein